MNYKTLHLHYDADQVFYKICFALASGGYQVVDGNGKKYKFGSHSEAREYVKANDLTLDNIFKMEEKDLGLDLVSKTIHSFIAKITQSCVDQYLAQADDNDEVDSVEVFYYLTGPINFRHALYPRYKEARKELVKPKYHSESKEKAIKEWGFILTDGLEADDLVSIGHTTSLANGFCSVIISIDKDLKTVPGWHFDPNKSKLYNVTEFEAARFFFGQCLTGDVIDGIPGIKGYGPVKTFKAFEGCTTEDELFDRVKVIYEKSFGEGWEHQLNMVMRLLWMVRDIKNYDPPYSV